MTFEDVDDLAASWRKTPPAAVTLRRLDRLVSAWLGVKEEPARKERDSAPMSLDEMIALAERMNAGARVAHG